LRTLSGNKNPKLQQQDRFQREENFIMQVATPISDAVANYRTNASVLDKCLTAITPEEALRQPSPHSNHAVWILGHMIWARATVLHFVGKEWSRPWFPLFVRGAALKEPAAYPAWQELIDAWQEINVALERALDEAPEAVLDRPSPPEIPSTDKKVSGLAVFFADHEAYHVGQISYLAKWLGHAGPWG
jgi:uncharacterized damage-inducible protein DinB